MSRLVAIILLAIGLSLVLPAIYFSVWNADVDRALSPLDEIPLSEIYEKGQVSRSIRIPSNWQWHRIKGHWGPLKFLVAVFRLQPKENGERPCLAMAPVKVTILRSGS